MPTGESNQTSEPKFDTFKKRVLTGSLIICLLGLPIGLILKLPYVWLLSIAGIIVTSFKLHKIKKQ